MSVLQRKVTMCTLENTFGISETGFQETGYIEM